MEGLLIILIINVFDCETTGKLHKDHRIIEASFRLCDLENEEELEAILMRFNPERNIDARALEIHKITNEELKKEPLFKDKAAEVKAILERSDIFIAHNLEGFDWPMLEFEFERAGLVLPEVKRFDTLLHGTFATDLGKRPTLSELCWSLDIVYDPNRAHKGDYDTEVLRDCVFRASKLGWFSF